jgi:peptidoglycan/LPS O-acetylase OafA/YrhL
MKYIKGFDGLRAVSILFVLLTHLGLSSHFDNHSFLKTNYNLISGSTGVMIFFTISGFLITLLLLHEKHKFQNINFKYFFARRFLRLLPPLLVFYFSIIILMAFDYLPKNYVAVAISFIYLYNFVPMKYYVSELGHTWSLGIEEQFYVLWPLLINYFKKIRKLMALILLIILISLFVKLIYHNSLTFDGKSYDLFVHFFPDRWFIPACLPIAIGSLSAILLFYYSDVLKVKLKGKIQLLIVSVVLFFMQLFIPNLIFALKELFMTLGVTLLLLWIYFNQQSVLVRILEFKLISFIGKISYGLYVYQGLFLRTGPGGDLDIQKFPLNIVDLFAAAIGSYFLLEKPILKYKKRFKRA